MNNNGVCVRVLSVSRCVCVCVRACVCSVCLSPGTSVKRMSLSGCIGRVCRRPGVVSQLAFDWVPDWGRVTLCVSISWPGKGELQTLGCVKPAWHRISVARSSALRVTQRVGSCVEDCEQPRHAFVFAAFARL